MSNEIVRSEALRLQLMELGGEFLYGRASGGGDSADTYSWDLFKRPSLAGTPYKTQPAKPDKNGPCRYDVWDENDNQIGTALFLAEASRFYVEHLDIDLAELGFARLQFGYLVEVVPIKSEHVKAQLNELMDAIVDREDWWDFNNDGSSGEFWWDLKANTFRVEGQWYYTESTPESYETDEGVDGYV
ncbi:MAG: hypothetical protein ACK5MY_02675 [Jhaorihella sp.]